MRVLVVTNMYPSETHPVFGAFVARQVKSLRRAGVDVDVVVNEQKSIGPIVNLAKYVSLAGRAARVGAGGSYDLVHAHYLYPTAIIGAWTARRARAPLVLTAHGNDVDNAANSRLAGGVRRALHDAAAIVAVSRYLAARLGERFGVEPECVDVIDCGVETEVFRPLAKAAARASVSLPDGERIVLFVGHLIEAKGIATLLAAHRRMLADGQQALLVVAGEGELATAVESAARDPDTRGLVRSLGRVPHEQMATLMTAADVVCVPSNKEGFGLVAVEAMACGVPVVASDVGGLPEIVADGSNGLLVPPADPDRLAVALASILQARNMEAFAETARRTALGHSLETQTSKLVKVYERLVRP